MTAFRAALALAAAVSAWADVVEFAPQKIANQHIARVSGMYGPGDGPAGSGVAQIKLKLEFQSTYEKGFEYNTDSPPYIEVGIMVSQNLTEVGARNAKGEVVRYCCSPGDKAGSCAAGDPQQRFNLLVADSASWRSVRVPLDENGWGHIDGAQGTFGVLESGSHVLIASSCNPDVLEIVMEGWGEWLSVYGHLPGQSFFFLPFYGVMTIILTGACTLWFILSVLSWRELFTLHYALSGIMFVFLFENMMWYFEFADFNTHGQLNYTLIAFATCLASLRVALCQICTLAVCYGWGVVKPTLSADVLEFLRRYGVCLFLAKATELLATRWTQTSGLGSHPMVYMEIPLYIITAQIFQTSLDALSITIQQLTERKQDLKLALYLKFRNCIYFAIATAVMSVAADTYIQVAHVGESWRYMWLYDGGLTTILYTIVLFAMAGLWIPDDSARRYAYTSVDTADIELAQQAASKMDTVMQRKKSVMGTKTN
jgi:hypothetical protein